MTYEIESVDTNTIFIVTIDDRPLVNTQGQTLLFYRHKDAEEAIANHKIFSNRGGG